MPPTPTTPRLATIDADAVALDAARRCLEAVERLSTQLQPGVTLHMRSPSADDLRASQVYLSTLDLCAWATRGDGALEEVQDLVQAVVSALSLRPLDVHRAETTAELVATLDEDDPVSLVCVAGWARYRLAEGAALSTDQLAALASVAPSRVRALVESGELQTLSEPRRKAGTLYAATECRRFLGARGVPGFRRFDGQQP